MEPINNNNAVTSDPPTQQQQPPVAAAMTVAPPPHWMPMQYPPAAAMLMPPHMIPGPQFLPPYLAYHHRPHFQKQQQKAATQQQGSGGDAGENRTIWVGDLHGWMDEDYLRNCFAPTGEVNSIKVIRNRLTGFSEGYGFVEFFTHAAAEKVLESYASIPMPNCGQPFRLNWATFSMGDKRPNNASDLSIFVGDLASDVSDALLHETFASKYPSVISAKVVMDANTGCSKGYGFVRFGDNKERSLAMTEMNGKICSTRVMRIGAATPRKSTGYQQQNSSEGENASNGESDGDTSNTTIFVGGLDRNINADELKKPFSQYGEIISVKIPIGKGCGFVQFANRIDAKEALQQVNGTTIGNQSVRLSWGRTPVTKQFKAGYGTPWARYGNPLVAYDEYGYPLPAYDPALYAASAAYGAYPMYAAHPQVR